MNSWNPRNKSVSLSTTITILSLLVFIRKQFQCWIQMWQQKCEFQTIFDILVIYTWHPGREGYRTFMNLSVQRKLATCLVLHVLVLEASTIPFPHDNVIPHLYLWKTHKNVPMDDLGEKNHASVWNWHSDGVTFDVTLNFGISVTSEFIPCLSCEAYATKCGKIRF